MFEKTTTLAVARILTTMATPSNLRSAPIAQDLAGNFDFWFDGGAVKHDTGISVYRFLDGSAATTGSSQRFAVIMQLPDGRLFEVCEKDRGSLHPAALLGLD